MAKAPQPRRISLDLGEKSLSALLLRSDGRLEAARVDFDATRGLDGALSALPEDLLRAPPSSPQVVQPGQPGQPGDGSASSVEVVLTTSRAFATLRRPPRIALLVTEGFEDMLLLDDRQHGARRPGWPFAGLSEICPRERCLGVPERLGADGSVVRPLTAEALGELRQRVARLDVAAIAVVLLHSYQNDAHERTICEALAPLRLPISISSAVARVPDERRRAFATLVDASLRLDCTAEVFALRRAGLLRVLRSDAAGDAAPASHASPLRQLYAATAAGLRGAQRIATAHGLSRFLALQLAGSFATVALHDPELLAELPRQSGPEALIDPSFEVPAQELRIVELHGTSDEERAATLVSALEAITIERGHDPAAYPLLGYGDVTQPLIQLIAERLELESARILPAPTRVVGYGALCAPLVLTRRELLSVEASSAQQIGQVAATLHTLENRLRDELKQEGYVTSSYLPGLEWLAELRYHGKEGHSLMLSGLGDGGPAVSGDTDLVVRFCAEHKRRYGFLLSECPVEIVALKVRVTLPVSTPSYSEFARLGEGEVEVSAPAT
jgi:N-methylhydantoinase A/oxoprolinase/acetone carboxylase beta subunit